MDTEKKNAPPFDLYPKIDISGTLKAIGVPSRLTARDDLSLEKYGKTEDALDKERKVMDEIIRARSEREKAEAEKEIKTAAEKVKTAVKIYKARPFVNIYGNQAEQRNNRKDIIMIGSVVFMFCLMTAAGIILASTIISRQVAMSASETAEKLVSTVSKTIERPVDAVGGGDISAMADKAMDPSGNNSKEIPEEVNDSYMRAIAQYPEAVKKAAGVSWSELMAFDSMVKSVSENSNNAIIKEVFSNSITAPINYIADGYRIWSYIMTAREKDPIDPGTALLEAASIVKYTSEYGVPLSLAVGVTQTESMFRPEAISNKKAYGPMQVVWDIHYKLLNNIGIKKRDELFTADKGIQAGCYLLGRYLKEEKSITMGLKRYYGALSPKYINTVVAHRYTFELFSSGVDKNVAMMALREVSNWNKLNAVKAPVIKASQIAARTAVKPSGQKMSVQPSAQPPAAMTVYKNVGVISIKRPDGTIIEKKLEE